MKVLILGATGGTGRHALAEALARGHEVSVLVRDRARLPPGSERVVVHEGDARDPETVSTAVTGQDAVICVLGVGKSLKPEGLIASVAPHIVQAITRSGVKRLVFTSAFGVGQTIDGLPFVPRLMIATMLRRIYADKNRGEAVIRQCAADWTIVYPSMLTDKPKTGQIRHGGRLELRGLPTISRADVGAFLVAQLESQKYVRQGVLITQA